MTLIPQLRGGQGDAVVWVNWFVGLVVKELICLLTTQPEGLDKVWNVLVPRTADPLRAEGKTKISGHLNFSGEEKSLKRSHKNKQRPLNLHLQS